MKEAEVSVFDEQYRVVESDRLLVRGILSGDVLTIINTEPETPLTQEDYPLGKLVSLARSRCLRGSGARDRPL